AARGVSAIRMPQRASASALARSRFQPVTACPAAISRGTMPAPMAPRPMNPIFMSSAEFGSARLGPHLVIAVGAQIEIVAVRIDGAKFRIMAVARSFERYAIAVLFEPFDEFRIVLDQEPEMVEATRFAVDLVGMDRQVHVAVGQRDAAVLGAMNDLEAHHVDI